MNKADVKFYRAISKCNDWNKCPYICTCINIINFIYRYTVVFWKLVENMDFETLNISEYLTFYPFTKSKSSPKVKVFSFLF